jgi:hypothetical protein
MLRQHYIGGIITDAAPKLLLSATYFGCNTIKSQKIELTDLSLQPGETGGV